MAIFYAHKEGSVAVSHEVSLYEPTRFMAAGSTYNKAKADYAVAFIQALKAHEGPLGR